jgi:Secretion system C-terminal sorting domain/FG-GAP-like repeat
MVLPKSFLLPIFLLCAAISSAQQFKPVQENPFGISTAPYAYNDMQFADLTMDGAFDIIFNAFDLEAGPFIMVNSGELGAPDFNGVPYIDYVDFVENGIGLGTFTGPGDMYYDIDLDGDLDLLFAYPSDDPTLESGYAFEINEQEQTSGMFLFFFSGAGEGTEIGLPLLPPMIYEDPTIEDLDGDGDDDILAIRYAENTSLSGFYFYENTTNGPTMFFNNTALEGPFGLPANLPDDSVYGFPCLIDGDMDGDLDLLVSIISGDWAYYENTGTATAPNFALPTINPLGLTSLPEAGQVHAIDVNNDGLRDLIVGSKDKVYYFELEPASAAGDVLPTSGIQLSPNPVSNQISVCAEHGTIASVTVSDVSGRFFKQLKGENGSRQITLQVSELPQGFYFAKVEMAQGSVQILRFVKQ